MRNKGLNVVLAFGLAVGRPRRGENYDPGEANKCMT